MKVKLPKEVVEAIERKRGDRTQCDMPPWSMKDYAEAYMNGIGDTQRSIRKVSFEILMAALVNGYEVEETPEDKVLNYYNLCVERAQESAVSSKYNSWNSEAHGIKSTLILLNIKIEGVNA